MTISQYEFRRNFAVIIGIDEYQDSDIAKLETAVSDAEKLAEILETRHEKLKEKYQEQNKYEVRLLKNVTKHELDELLKDFKAGKIFPDQIEKINKNDRVLFYFAGHGIALDALENQEGPVGYFFPKDAENGKVETYLPMQELHDALKELECRHMLAILDCCFAGAFQWVRRDVKSPVKVYKERYDCFIQDAAWQVITSAAYDQEALDSPGIRGKVQYEKKVHSPFAKALFDALLGESNQQNAYANKNGIITANELYLYLREEVEISTDENFQRQTPGYCPLRKHDKGEFIFLLPDFDRDNLDDAPPLNLENNPYRGLYSYEYNKRDSELFFGRKTLIQELEQKIVLNLEETKVAQQAVKNAQSNSVSSGKGLTVVLGASGTGKSSLVKAGLLPLLEKQSQLTIITPMRPRENPIKSLAQVFLPIINEDAANWSLD